MINKKVEYWVKEIQEDREYRGTWTPKYIKKKYTGVLIGFIPKIVGTYKGGTYSENMGIIQTENGHLKSIGIGSIRVLEKTGND